MELSKYELAKKLAEKALDELLQKGDKDRATGTEILNWLVENEPNFIDKIRSSWGSFLTKASDDPASRIMREPGRYGYMLRKEIDQGAENYDEATNSIPTQPDQEPERSYPEIQREQREIKLYSLLVEWLLAKDYYAADTSTNKKGGAWGNPDVVGIRVEDGISGITHLELVTIEAKTSQRDWRRVFFEAVSHKRFADRAYFAFATSSKDIVLSQLPDFVELREYGEKYRVGILAIFIEPSQYEDLLKNQSLSEFNLSLEDVRVEEVWPAVHDPVSPFTRERFLREVLDIQTQKDLHRFSD